ncbi:GtrA family protein [Escherichia coli]|nr:GtrA family protein [Escherichia coli]
MDKSSVPRIFAKYMLIGIINTAIHWLVFALSMSFLHTDQATANLLGFCVAVTFSFFMNARFTFKSATTRYKYFIFVLFMGALAFIAGTVSDQLKLPAIITLVFFSGTSLVLGFLFSKFVVFKD